MRDESYFDEMTTVSMRAGRSRWAAAAGAVASVVALALLVTWAYRLGVRDAHAVPVIRAVEGPAKIRPEDPGGARFDHQGRAVYDAVRGASAEDDAAAAPLETALAPPPESLSGEDRAPAEVAAAIAATAAAEEAAAAAAIAAAPETDVAQRIEALVAEAVGAAPVELALVDPTARAPVVSPVARARPGSAAAAVAAAPVAAPAAEPSAEPVAAPGPIVLAGPMIQLGAYLSDEMALQMWREISRRNGDLFAGRDPVLGAVRQGGQDLVLLRAGPFESGDQALALCAQMRARNEDCLTVGAR